MSIPTETIIPEIEEIVKFYEAETVEKVARDKGFVKRESKIGGIEFLSIMTYGLFSQPDASLTQMVAMLKDINEEIEITSCGLHQRINRSGVEFLKEMFSKALSLSAERTIDESIPKLLEHFEKVHIIDSTQVSLSEEMSEIWRGSGGDGSSSSMKIQFLLDYKSGSYESISLREGTESDQSYIDKAIELIGEKEVLIYDLGYFKQSSMIDISYKSAYFLSRYNHRTGLYEREEGGELLSFDILKAIKKAMSSGELIKEYEVWLSKEGRELKVRLIAEKIPDEIAEERRRKANRTSKKKGRTPTDKHLFLLGWNLYITNISSEILPSSSVRTLYSLRWQIELVFKTWKSYNGLTNLRGSRSERIECFMYGRLILLTIMSFLSAEIHRYLWSIRKREASFMKILRHFQVKSSKALSLLKDSLSFSKFLWKEFLEAVRLCPMELRKRLSTLQKIRMISHVIP